MSICRHDPQSREADPLQPKLTERLLNSILNRRLVLFCGAGLSMAEPSRVPSANELARICLEKYEREIGVSLDHLGTDLEKLAEYFAERDLLYQTFIRKLLPTDRFRRNPNRGHTAIADFLAAGIVEFVVSTNIDYLIEEAARLLGEPNPMGALDGAEANVARDHKPHLKIHGCLVRDDKNTLWCKRQLGVEPICQRNQELTNWLSANLRERDVVFLGFWTDWAYLNEVFEQSVSSIERGMIVIVNPSDEETLKAKAPRLWEFANSGRVACHLVLHSADEFLDELRGAVWRWFLENLLRRSKRTYSQLVGTEYAGPVAFPADLSSDDLHALKLDACGVPRHQISRTREPDETMEVLGAVHLGLLNRGATLQGSRYMAEGKRVRVLYAQGRTLSAVRQKYAGEVQPLIPDDIVICVGAKDDGGAAANVVRPQRLPSNIVRPALTGRWVPEDDAMHLWGEHANS